MKHKESFMTSNKMLDSEWQKYDLEYYVHCITLVKERKKREKVTLASRFYTTRAYESCLACEHFFSQLLIGHIPRE